MTGLNLGLVALPLTVYLCTGRAVLVRPAKERERKEGKRKGKRADNKNEEQENRTEGGKEVEET